MCVYIYIYIYIYICYNNTTTDNDLSITNNGSILIILIVLLIIVRLRVLSQLERSGLLSTVESSASDKYGAASYGTTGLLFITAAIAAR